MENKGDVCFVLVVVSELYLAKKHAQRVFKYPYYLKVANWTGIDFSMPAKQRDYFEKQNDVTVNVYILEKTKKKFYVDPTYLTRGRRNGGTLVYCFAKTIARMTVTLRPTTNGKNTSASAVYTILGQATNWKHINRAAVQWTSAKFVYQPDSTPIYYFNTFHGIHRSGVYIGTCEGRHQKSSPA